jgi:hypothetical protein
MKKLKAILLEKSDFIPNAKKTDWQFSLCKPAYDETLTADIVIYRGRILKNRWGSISANAVITDGSERSGETFGG